MAASTVVDPKVPAFKYQVIFSNLPWYHSGFGRERPPIERLFDQVTLLFSTCFSSSVLARTALVGREVSGKRTSKLVDTLFSQKLFCKNASLSRLHTTAKPHLITMIKCEKRAIHLKNLLGAGNLDLTRCNTDTYCGAGQRVSIVETGDF